MSANDARRPAVHPITAAHELPPEAGGKAHGLRLIARAGLHVPAAWAVLPGAAPSDLADLADALRERGLRSVAVRSSGADEDGARASFAGVHETALGVPAERLRETVAAVAASALSERAASYRRQLGLPPARGACAVVVQEMVDADAAGVAFGRGADEIAVEAVEGLGEVAVSGEAIPEMLVLRRAGAGWTLVRREPRLQRSALRHGEAGPVRVAIPEPRQRADVLAAAAAAAIAAGVSALETAAGGPLDVEWATTGGRISFLQARPQTRAVSAPLPAGEAWSRANLRELTPEIPCALTRSGVVPAADSGTRVALRRQGVRIDPAVPLTAAVHGRLVYNERAFYAIGDAFGLGEPFRAWVRSFVGGGAISNDVPRFDPRAALRHPVLLVRGAIWAAGAERNARRFLAWLRARRAVRDDAPDGGDARLLARIRGSHVWIDSDRWMVAVMRVVPVIANAFIEGAAILRRPDTPAVLARLAGAHDPSVSTRQIDDLVAIALRLRGWPGAAPFLAEAPAEAERWRARVPPEIWVAIERWLRDYGHRGPWESDASSPRYRDDLRLVARTLAPLVTAPEPPEGAEERRLRRARDAEAAWVEVARAVGPLARARLRGIVRTYARAGALREQLRSELMIDHARVRDDARELGRRLALAGRLDAPDDVFHLELAELERAVADPAWDARAAVRRELARRAAWRRIEVPNRFTTEEIDGMAARGPGAGTVAGAMRGTAVSPGEAEAPACVLRSPDEGARMPTGAVLVAPTTDPGWTPLFARASAVVVEIGGLFSHAATVAREYGLPAVSNVERATDLLRDGDVVRVDGSRGVVEVISRAPPG
jgi:pyruvate,water dikinase